MNIFDIYEKYQNMPQQAEHHFKVAAVAGIILDNLTPAFSQPEKEEIITACLLHDLGNIVKFDFRYSLFPEIVAEKGLAFWEKVKESIKIKYGFTSHAATHSMLMELGVGERILELVDAVGFDEAKDNAESQDFGKKICAYSDMRVLPRGVGSLEERIVDLRIRYKNHKEGASNREVFEEALREIEKQIFARCKIKPEEITEESIKSLADILRKLNLSTRQS